MSPSSRSSAAALLSLLFLPNIVGGWLISAFWSSKIDATEKAVLFTGEIVALALAFLVLLLTGYVFSRLIKGEFGCFAYFIAFVPVFGISALSWGFYLKFGKFLGLTAFQMAYHDGLRVLGIGAGMPSMWSGLGTPLLFGLIYMLLAYYISYSATSLARQFRSLSMVTLCAFTVTLVGFNLFGNFANTAESQGREESEKFAQSTELVHAAANRGPFSRLLADTIAWLKSDDNKTDFLDKLNLLTIDAPSPLGPKDHLQKQNHNVVFILIESMRPDVLELLGGTTEVMPELSKLADRGLVFSNVWAQSTHSNYADIAALSGQYPLRSTFAHFYTKNPPYPRSRPWEHLAQYNYISAGFSSGDDNWGKMTNFIESPNLSVFDHVGMKGNSYSPAKEVGIQEGEEGKDIKTFMMQDSGLYGTSRWDEITTEKALNWVDSNLGKKPFFLYLNYQASHYPFNQFPPTFERRFLLDNSEESEKVKRGAFIGASLKTVQSAYYDSLAYVDTNIGSLVNKIEERNPGNTIYVITADTSTLMGGGVLGNGAELHPEVLKIPLVIAAPEIEHKVVDSAVAQIDIMPTVYGMLNLAPDPAAQGQNALDDSNPNTDRFMFSVAQTPLSHQYGVTYRDWHLVLDHDTANYTATYIGSEKLSESTESKEYLALMSSQLNNWIGSQIQYYNSPEYHTNYYPPSYEQLANQGAQKSISVAIQGE